MSKSDLLDREADDLAVRVALGETQVIAETKKALTNAGVNITALEEIAAGKKDGMKRSNHVLLVKNLSYGSSEVELAEKFGKFGSLDKIILPPTKTLALVHSSQISHFPIGFNEPHFIFAVTLFHSYKINARISICLKCRYYMCMCILDHASFILCPHMHACVSDVFCCKMRVLTN